MDLVEQRLDLRWIKAGEAEVKITVLNVLQEVGQQVFIPRAGDLVESDVERLFAGLVYIHHGTGYLGEAQVDCHSQALMPADDRHVGIHDQRIGEAKLLNRRLDLLILLVAGLELFAGIVFSRFQYGDRQHLQFSGFH